MSAKPAPVRCEVCRVVLGERPDPRRRRCADHLDQQPLFPLSAVPGRRTARKAGSR
ncbi:hypothetical protein Psed_5530 [Pseudonocardia dioxanivorans CB1190]|uniref:Uncharacterized protein n=1 Tax=Pseudonocardia dioxanivorans (strain ATCC 55486 / DSM 44775 / JCM 13855 / CB1190) TaxID=675635 RepID=F4CYT5_PSEUX|nr:hypothetical protein Psed_5530 [Pseudonocardia dioxanivorans CB1190]